MIAARRGNVGRGKRIKVSWQEQPLRREGGMEIGEREDDRVGGEEEKKSKAGIGREGDGVRKRGRKGRPTCSLQSETGRDNLLTVLLCYQQKGSRY